MIQAQYFHYEILEEYPLSELESYKEHRRLRVFYHKGCKCVECGIEGTKLALGKQKKGSLHVDVYTDDFYPLTVDHIVPKSKGGSDDISNLQPMCCLCNWRKGNGDKPSHIGNRKYKYSTHIPITDHSSLVFTKEGISEGDVVYRRVKKKKFEVIGGVLEFCINPHTMKEAVKIENKKYSMYSLTAVFKPLIN